jgi:predicted component of type VI protein secretion system
MSEVAFTIKTSRAAHPAKSTIFVLGLLGVSGSVPFAVCAWYFGNRLLRKHDAEPGRLGHRGWVETGRTL